MLARQFVLEPCIIPSCLNIMLLRQLLKNYIEPRISLYEEMNRPIFLEDEFTEHYIAKATNGKVIGKGNCGMDVITENNEGIDVMAVIMNKYISNEKSLMQKFTNEIGRAHV